MRVLFALDGTAAGDEAAEAIGPWIRASGAEVVLMSVLDPGEIHGAARSRGFTHALTPAGTMSGQYLRTAEPLSGAVEDRGQALERARAEREDYLWAIARNFFSGVAVEVVTEHGSDPAEEILTAASTRGADMIALGARNRAAMTEALFGSVHEAVVRRATIPVLIAGPAAEAREISGAHQARSLPDQRRQLISERAYELFRARAELDGDDGRDWYEAERQLTREGIID